MMNQLVSVDDKLNGKVYNYTYDAGGTLYLKLLPTQTVQQAMLMNITIQIGEMFLHHITVRT